MGRLGQVLLSRAFWGPVTWICIGVFGTLSWTIHRDLNRIGERIDQSHAVLEHFRLSNAALARAASALTHCQADRLRLGYTLWEVHEMDAIPSGLESQPEKLCASVGSHSALRLGTVFDGHEIWNNAAGRVVLGCRYIKLKEE